MILVTKVDKESEFSTLSQRRRRHKIILYHKIINGNKLDMDMGLGGLGGR